MHPDPALHPKQTDTRPATEHCYNTGEDDAMPPLHCPDLNHTIEPLTQQLWEHTCKSGAHHNDASLVCFHASHAPQYAFPHPEVNVAPRIQKTPGDANVTLVAAVDAGRRCLLAEILRDVLPPRGQHVIPHLQSAR